MYCMYTQFEQAGILKSQLRLKSIDREYTSSRNERVLYWRGTFEREEGESEKDEDGKKCKRDGEARA